MRSFRLAAVGDGLIGPLVHSARDATGPTRSFIDNRFLTWLRVIMPAAELAENAVFGMPGETTVAVARRAQTVLDLDPLPDAVLICAGMEDCLATIKGVAPAPEQTVGALEELATKFSASGVMPIFVVPPPCAQFSNGLFADRFVAIAATLRRMQEREKRIALVDPTDLLKKRGSFGVEPDPRYVSAGADGRLSSLGAFRLAGEVARQLRPMIPERSIGRPLLRGSIESLNTNPLMTGQGGKITARAVSGRCATAYCIDAHQLGGLKVKAAKHKGQQTRMMQRLTFSGRYTTSWGFVRISNEIDAGSLGDLAAGDVIDAVCDFGLAGPVENIAAVSLHATPVWENGFVGLHSSQYSGGAGVSEPHGGRLCTPQFVLPAKLKKLHISVHVHLVPGVNLSARGRLDIRMIAARKVERQRATAARAVSRTFVSKNYEGNLEAGSNV